MQGREKAGEHRDLCFMISKCGMDAWLLKNIAGIWNMHQEGVAKWASCCLRTKQYSPLMFLSMQPHDCTSLFAPFKMRFRAF